LCVLPFLAHTSVQDVAHEPHVNTQDMNAVVLSSPTLAQRRAVSLAAQAQSLVGLPALCHIALSPQSSRSHEPQVSAHDANAVVPSSPTLEQRRAVSLAAQAQSLVGLPALDHVAESAHAVAGLGVTSIDSVIRLGVGAAVGLDVGVAVGLGVDVTVGLGVGAAVGLDVGAAVGLGVTRIDSVISLGVGAAVGLNVFAAVGLDVGAAVGMGVGTAVGLDVGAAVGMGVGVAVGLGAGAAVGLDVGAAVGLGAVTLSVTTAAATEATEAVFSTRPKRAKDSPSSMSAVKRAAA